MILNENELETDRKTPVHPRLRKLKWNYIQREVKQLGQDSSCLGWDSEEEVDYRDRNPPSGVSDSRHILSQSWCPKEGRGAP